VSDFTLPEPALALAPSGARTRRFNGGLWGGVLILAIIAIGALIGPLLMTHDPYSQDLVRRLAPPVWLEGGTWLHIFGTDAIGRDYLARVVYGARISLLIGLAVVVISGTIGLTLGLLAGYFGGKTDLVVTFITTTRLALPVILVALAVVGVIGSSLLIVILVLGLLKWDRFAVVMRSAVQQARSRDYVAAAEAAGYSTPRILLHEILPNVLPHFIVVATLEMASAILIEASLSFLGLGVPSPLPSWGLLISEAKPYMLFDFWLIAIPGAALSILVLAINLVGDGLRDALAPDGRA
jgi:peptide/nickel transport system permease protein